MAADDATISDAKRGEPEAWRELYRLHAGRLVSWLNLRPVDDASMAAEDVASEAWLVAASKIADFRGSVGDFGGWLFGIARKISSTAQRTAQRRATSPAAEPGEYITDTVLDHSLEHQRLAGVRDVLAALSPSERDAIALVDCLGVRPREAAQVLGVSDVALRVARHRGLKRLKATPMATLGELLGDPV